MSGEYNNEPMLEMFLFETSQNIEQMESCILSSEKTGCYAEAVINEIFRIMHTIKGSSAMMLFNQISTLAHSIEDLFYYLREQKPVYSDCTKLSDLVLEGVDFIKIELEKIKSGDVADGNCQELIERIKEFISELKQNNPSANTVNKPEAKQKQQYYIPSGKSAQNAAGNVFKAILFFEEGCEMENIRAYSVIHNLKELTDEIAFFPEDIIENDKSVEAIRQNGFQIHTRVSKTKEEMHQFFMQVLFLKELELIQIENDEVLTGSGTGRGMPEDNPIKVPKLSSQDGKDQPGRANLDKEPTDRDATMVSSNQSIISVNVAKLDALMDLVGELVISEAIVTQNPDLKGLELDNFRKAARQLHKITSELQDMVMSIRMVPLSTTFHKMHRLIRDMSKKLNKEVELVLVGEETEVDKNIIEHIADPLMHLVRNSIDHGIETVRDREAAGKPGQGKVVLEAKNEGSDVLILVRDDGRGLNKEKILKRARENDLLFKQEQEMTDREIYNLIFLPGFSTKDSITEFSGRGVGMDVVVKNIEAVGGSVSVDSAQGEGTTVTFKIPLTLAIIDGMNIRVGESHYTIPTTAIKESFRPKQGDVINDPEGNEMIMVRGQCYPIIRLHECFGVRSGINEFTEGILIMAEQDSKVVCLFADELIGQQQVVVKALPNYIRNKRKIEGLAGCTLLGDGSISLIINIGGLLGMGKAS